MNKKDQNKSKKANTSKSSQYPKATLKNTLDLAKSNEALKPAFIYMKKFNELSDDVFNNDESITEVSERMNASGTLQSVIEGNLWDDIIRKKFRKKYKETWEDAIKKAKNGSDPSDLLIACPP